MNVNNTEGKNNIVANNWKLTLVLSNDYIIKVVCFNHDF